MKWQDVEKAFAKQFSAKLVSDKYYQNQDIDAISKRGKTVSIKHHPTGNRTGNVAFEYYLVNPTNGDKINGNFLYCKAEIHADLIGGKWYIFEHEKLFEWVCSNKHRYQKRTLSSKAIAGNANWGAKKYRDSEFYLIPIKDLEHLATYVVEAKL